MNYKYKIKKSNLIMIDFLYEKHAFFELLNLKHALYRICCNSNYDASESCDAADASKHAMLVMHRKHAMLVIHGIPYS